MANDYDLWRALQLAIKNAVSQRSFLFDVFIDWPPDSLFAQLTEKEQSAIIVFDSEDMARPTTRWKSIRMDVIMTQCNTSTLPSAEGLAPTEVGTITLSARTDLDPVPTVPAVGDAVSCVIGYHTYTRGVVAQAVAGDTFTTLAAKLAAAINAGADPKFSGVFSATSSGPVVTITNVGTIAVGLNSYAGNNGTQLVEVGREERVIQVACFCADVDQRAAIAGDVKGVCADLQSRFGVKFADGTAARVLLKSNKYFRDYHRNDLWRFDQYLACDQGITTNDELYSFLVPKVDTVPGY